MYKVVGIIALIALGIAGYLYLVPDAGKTQESLQEAQTIYSNPELGLEFTYRPGPEGYVLEQRTPSPSEEGPERVIVLMRSQDVAQGAPEGGEGPPVIAIQVFRNAQNQFPLQWAQENVQYSTFNLKRGEESSIVVGGANAIRYMADGLYASENVVVAHGDFMYVITGQFMDEHSDLRRDFDPLVQSLTFIPTVTATGKIDIAAICEGALAYMSFPDGAAAEAFVNECKDGKHPEVIEQWKQQMGISDNVAL